MMIAARTIVEFHAVSHVVNGGMVGALHLRHGSLFPVEKKTATFHIIILGDIV